MSAISTSSVPGARLGIANALVAKQTVSLSSGLF